MSVIQECMHRKVITQESHQLLLKGMADVRLRIVLRNPECLPAFFRVNQLTHNALFQFTQNVVDHMDKATDKESRDMLVELRDACTRLFGITKGIDLELTLIGRMINGSAPAPQSALPSSQDNTSQDHTPVSYNPPSQDDKLSPHDPAPDQDPVLIPHERFPQDRFFLPPTRPTLPDPDDANAVVDGIGGDVVCVS